MLVTETKHLELQLFVLFRFLLELIKLLMKISYRQQFKYMFSHL